MSPGSVSVDVEPGEARLSYLALPVLRRLLPALVLIALVLCAGPWLLRARDRLTDRALAERAAEDLLRLQEEGLERSLEALSTTILYIAGQRILAEHLSGRVGREALEKEYLHLARVADTLEQVRVIDTKGREHIRVQRHHGELVVVPEAELQDKSHRYYVKPSLELPRAGVYLSRYDLNYERHQLEIPPRPMLRIATPVFDAEGVKRGILVFNQRGRDVLEEMARSVERFPGWTAIVDKDGTFVGGPALGRLLGPGFEPPPKLADPDWQRIRDSEAGSFVDERGLFAFRSVEPELTSAATLRLEDFELRVVAVVPDALLYADSQRAFARLAGIAGVAALVSLAVAWQLAHAGATRARDERRLAESEQRLRQLSRGLIEAQEVERARLSRDLHDEVGQLGTAVGIDLQLARSAKSVDDKDRFVERAASGMQELLASAHRISSQFRASALDELGLGDALRAACDELARRGPLQTSVELDVDESALPERVAVALYRCAQEALSNVSRHAQASTLVLRVWQAGGRIHLMVRDDGNGFDPDAVGAGRLGLLGMRERVALLAGSFAIHSEPGQGTRVEVSLPLA